MKTKEEKIRFLEALGIRDNYEHNIVHCSSLTSDPGRIEFMYRDPNSERFISGAFVWRFTPEGKEFWEIFDKIWQKYLDGNTTI